MQARTRIMRKEESAKKKPVRRHQKKHVNVKKKKIAHHPATVPFTITCQGLSVISQNGLLFEGNRAVWQTCVEHKTG